MRLIKRFSACALAVLLFGAAALRASAANVYTVIDGFAFDIALDVEVEMDDAVRGRSFIGRDMDIIHEDISLDGFQKIGGEIHRASHDD